MIDTARRNGIDRSAQPGAPAGRPAITDPALSMVALPTLLHWLGNGEPPPASAARSAERPVEDLQPAPAIGPSALRPTIQRWAITDRWTLPLRRGALRRPSFIVSEAVKSDASSVWPFHISSAYAPAAGPGQGPIVAFLGPVPQPLPEPRPTFPPDPPVAVPLASPSELLAETLAHAPPDSFPALPPPLAAPLFASREPWSPPAEEPSPFDSVDVIPPSQTDTVFDAADHAGAGHPSDLEETSDMQALLTPARRARRPALAPPPANPIPRFRLGRPGLVALGLAALAAFGTAAAPLLRPPAPAAASAALLQGIVTGATMVITAPTAGNLDRYAIGPGGFAPEGAELFVITPSSAAAPQAMPAKADQPSRIVRLLAATGTQVQAGTPILELVDCRQLSVVADAQAPQARSLVAGHTLGLSFNDGTPIPAATVTMPTLPPRAANLILPLTQTAPVVSDQDCPLGRIAVITLQ